MKSFHLMLLAAAIGGANMTLPVMADDFLDKVKAEVVKFY